MEKQHSHGAGVNPDAVRHVAVSHQSAIIALFIASFSLAVTVSSQRAALFILIIAIAFSVRLIWKHWLAGSPILIRVATVAVVSALIAWLGWPRNTGTVSVPQIAPKIVGSEHLIVFSDQFWNDSRFGSVVSVYKGIKFVSKGEQNLTLDEASVKDEADVAAAENSPDATFTVNPWERRNFQVTSGPLTVSQYRDFSHGDYVFYVAEVMTIKGDIWPTRRTFCWYNQGNRQIAPIPCK